MHIRANIFYGLIALVPVAIFLLVAYYIYSLWTLALLPASDYLGLTTVQSRVIAVLLAIPAFFLFCYVLGALIRTRLGTITFDYIEQRLLAPLPGYDIVANLLRGFADRKSNYPAALVRFADTDSVETPAFVMEDKGGAHVTVFVPFAPLMTMGQVYVVRRERVTIFPNATIEVANHISQWGIGLQALVDRSETVPIRNRPAQREPDE